jgi:hypothetical protein
MQESFMAKICAAFSRPQVGKMRMILRQKNHSWRDLRGLLPAAGWQTMISELDD